MDMSIKLNSSYPTPIVSTGAAEKNLPKSERVTEKSTVAEQEPDKKELEVAVKEIQDFFQALKRNLEFSVDDSTGQVVVKVIASDSGQLIRQIPSQTALELAKSLSTASSLLFDEKA